MNSFGVQLHQDFKIEHLYCVDHNIQLTAKLACDDKNFGFDAADNPYKMIHNCKAIVIHYRLSTQAAQKFTGKKQKCWGKFDVLGQDTLTRWWSTYNMLGRIDQSKTCLKTLEMEEEISLSIESYLTRSVWNS
jgi:hypothetical protein